jgi:hypothetical protein
VAAAFAAHGFEVDLVPTKDLNRKVVRERFADYARTLTSDDTFVLYTHGHGGPSATSSRAGRGSPTAFSRCRRAT